MPENRDEGRSRTYESASLTLLTIATALLAAMLFVADVPTILNPVSEVYGNGNQTADSNPSSSADTNDYHEFRGSPMPADMEEDPSSFLAATGPLEQDLDLSTSDQDAAQAVSDGLRDAKAPNTRRAYASAWHTFLEWTILTGRESMPAAPQSVALYLGHLAAEGKSLATISQARAAISHAHAAAGISQNENPARHPVVAEMVKGWRNTSPAPAQVDALTALALARVRETARLPRRGRGGRRESAETAQARGAVDLAIIGVMSDGGLRRSEAAALTWNDIEFWADETARITIQKSKNQVEPATVAVTETTAHALREIQPNDADPTAPVFGLTGEALASRIRASARAAGLGNGFSGHSGRIGMARRMVAAGAPNAAVQHQGRWRHGDMVARYTRGEAAGDALKWLS